MIVFEKINKAKPYVLFKKLYNDALRNHQKNIEAMCISSYDYDEGFVDSRYVNLKYIDNDEWIFFSNYEGPKARQFKSNNQVSIIFYWSSINIQVRLRALIKKTAKKKSNSHFSNRSKEKNALAIASEQSKKIESYDKFLELYNDVLDSKISLNKRPEYWGGYSFQPFYFEFWHGHNSRLNRREVFEFTDNKWKSYFLQP